MRIIYTRKKFAGLPRGAKINIIKSGLFEIPNPTFWENLKQFKSNCKQKIA